MLTTTINAAVRLDNWSEQGFELGKYRVLLRPSCNHHPTKENLLERDNSTLQIINGIAHDKMSCADKNLKPQDYNTELLRSAL